MCAIEHYNAHTMVHVKNYWTILRTIHKKMNVFKSVLATSTTMQADDWPFGGQKAEWDVIGNK